MTWQRLCAILFLVIARSSLSEGQCYDGWVKYGSSCYGFGEEDVSWAGAAALCGIFDATLAEIESADENSFIEGIARNRSYHALWLGGTDIFSEGNWVWLGSKTPIQGFTDWYPGEPNHLGGASNEDCLQLYGPENLQWNDEDCKVNTRFVCEIKLEEGAPVGR